MRHENIVLIKWIEKFGTNNEGLKKKLEFRGTYFNVAQNKATIFIVLLRIGRNGMVEKWITIASE
jgi:hypothetical protein